MTSDDDDDITRNYHGGNPESAAAHEDTKKYMERDFACIIAYAKSCGYRGMTDDEAKAALGWDNSTCSARCSQLRAADILVRTNEKRLTRSGSWARVCVHIDFIRPTPQADIGDGDQPSLL
jgi:hypothetical protein